ncbi:MAG: undecaprenyldiphospho-muramoylpentapeptide beta-N-acetylglucosaminyltransferase [Armatimonadetes bacterium]|nr:undecaprenyldiphospho-muramoylpentapeptide beta-N-acetylglucosaminyltransferase [Armatimonadota bacterium]
MRIALTGGGTGGHIYPAISVAQALRELEPTVELLYVGSLHGPEGRIVTEAGIPFRAVPSSPLRRSLSAQNAVSLLKLLLGVLRARRILREFAPEVLIGTGGYTTAAVLVAQRTLGGQVVIHEQNVIPGRTNRWLARVADRVCLSFDSTAQWFPQEKVVVTGLPVRKEFLVLPGKTEARRRLGLRENLFTLLVVGGSQGARMLNELLIGAWPLLDDGSTQVLHQVGARNIENTNPPFTGQGVEERYRIEAYLDMPTAMAAADLLIGRSGASTVAEIMAAGLPSILVPYPHAVAGEQMANARYLVDRGAALMFQEHSLTCEVLADAVSELRSSRGKLESMAKASRSLAKLDAARTVADVVLSLARENRKG